MSRDRIKKLLGMTMANGCTEAEALMAAAKAAQLMREMGLRPGDIEMDQDDARARTGINSVRARLWSIIAVCTNTASIFRRQDGQNVVTYVGREPGPEVATYLHVLTDRAIDREMKIFRASTWYKRRRTLKAKRLASDAFLEGMVVRLTNRLFDLFETTQSDLQLEEARAERDARFPSSRQAVARNKAPSHYWTARSAGHLAAGKIDIHHGVGGAGEAPLQLEGTR